MAQLVVVFVKNIREDSGIATIRLFHGKIRKAEVHWYEAHGIGKKRFKIKRFLDKKI